MTVMVRIGNVSEALNRRLRARGATEGISMSQIVLREIERALAHPSRQELLKAIRSQPEAELDPSPAELLREGRDQP